MVCRSDTMVSPAKTAEPIEMSFGMWTPVGPRNCVLDEGTDPPTRMGNFAGEGLAIVKYRDALPLAVQKWLKRSRCRLKDSDYSALSVGIRQPLPSSRFVTF